MERRRGMLVLGALALAFTGARIYAGDDVQPTQSIHIREVKPAFGAAGDALVAFGHDLNTKSVKELWLTDGKKDYKVDILQQTENTIRFKIPATVPAGKFRLMVLDSFEMLLEQPAFVDVREAVRPTS